jgi:rRNA maturation endonuclease Nob1
MTNNIYIVDTSSLVKLNRNNPIDVFPSIWNKLKLLSDNNRLMAPKEVFNEIKQNDDMLSKWAKQQKKMFKEPTQGQIIIVQKILREYPALIDAERKYDADPWVIALAIEMNSNQQMTLFTIKRIVVTEEKLRGNQIKIPFVCNQKSIEAIDIVELFRTEGWKF